MTDLYQNLIASLEACRGKRILITTHVRPDGDALGSLTALFLACVRQGIMAEALLLSHWPTKYAFLAEQSGIQFTDVEGGWPANFSLAAYDALVVVDTGTFSQLPGLERHIQAFAGTKLVIDHHLTQQNWADQKLIVNEAAAAGEIIAELIEQWELPIDEQIATALFIAITTDTGWFQFSNTRPYTLRLAAILLEAGVDMDDIYQRLYQSERRERIALQARAMQSLELLCEGRLAVMTLRMADFKETGANVADTENLINTPMQIGSVEVSVLITEPIDFGPIRVSLRSKGQVDVARFAERFGGGGHVRAAGMKMSDGVSTSQTHQQVIGAMKAAMGCPA